MAMNNGVTHRRSLRVRIVLPLIVIGTGMLVTGALYIQQNFAALFDKQLHERAQVIGNALTYAAEITGESPQLARIVNSLGAESNVLLITVVAGAPSRVIACTSNIWVGRRLALLPDVTERTQLEKVLSEHTPFVQFDESAGVTRYNVPLHLSAGHDGSIAQAEGALHVVLDARPTRKVLSQAARSQMAALLAAIIGISLVAYLLLDRLVLRPVNGIRATVDQRALGNLTAYAPVLSQDEIGGLATSFNVMLDALAESEMRSRGILETVADVIVTVDEAGRVQSFNRAGERIFGYARQDVIGLDVSLLVGEERYAAHFRLPASTEPTSSTSFEIVGRRADGSTFPAELVVTEFDLLGRRLHNGIIRDITERKRAEEALRELNESLELRVVERTGELSRANEHLQAEIVERKRAAAELEVLHGRLVALSRQAGMAEVAVGVLHNVGNVLNSVTTASSLLATRLRNSKASNLTRVAGLLKANAAALGTFLTEDEKGRQVPGYIGKLAEHLDEERAELLSEVQTLATHIEHIRQIIDAQQSRARAVDVSEPLELTTLLDDALRMNASSLEGLGVRVERDYAAIPPMTVDKHRLLQILVNLIQNGKTALEQGGEAEKRLIVRSLLRDGQVTIQVIDNGVGIPGENLLAIFSYGFTTRRDGHGFGLHSSALAAKEMGGSLSVHSDGPDQGATFTLVLPFQPRSAPPRSPAS